MTPHRGRLGCPPALVGEGRRERSERGVRGFAALALALACAALLLPAALPAGEARRPSAVQLEDEGALLRKLKEKGPRDVAIERGVAFLASKQNADGSFGDRHKVAMTGLAVIAFMAAGCTPDEPRVRVSGDPQKASDKQLDLRKAIEFVLLQMRREDGYLGHIDNSRMYGHGICTLMLTEAAGMTGDERLERRLVDAVRRATQLILKAQAIKKAPHHQGGWRYEPNSGDSDLSLTGWQTMSLRAARDIGIEIPADSINQAIAYVRRMAAKDGGFGYEGPNDQRSLRGLGLLALPVCGVYDAPELAKTTQLMFRDPPKFHGPWFFYYIYYAATGMYQMGDDAWERFYPFIDNALLPAQKPDGSWPDAPGNNEWDYGGEVYTTSMALLALSVHYHLLPIYQR